MKYRVLIVGYGSIGKRHYDILKDNKRIEKIYILTKQKIKNSIKNIKYILKLNINYVIICSETHKHYKQLLWLDKNCRNIKILIEKPLFNKYHRVNLKNNNYFVGYNMRFNPIILKLKKIISGFHLWNINILCSSYLPLWRKGDYKKSYSAIKSKGGGVLLDLSHELDYARFLFGDYKILYSKIKKNSNLKINVEDIAIIVAENKQKTIINFNINYFSKIPLRNINIQGRDISINANLVNKTIKGVIKNKKVSYNFSNYSRNYTYSMEHKYILNDKNEILSTFQNGLEINKLIDLIKSKR